VANESGSRFETDRAEIMRLHNEWMRANCGLVVEGMRGVFVGGDRFQGFNLNGHTYFQRDEWERLWRYLCTVMQIAEIVDEKIEKLAIRGDTAWLAFEATITVRALPQAGAASSGLQLPVELVPMRFRGTEVFVREDENGRPAWKMWHVHYSPCAPASEPRPGFGS
jgi:SnoaL-like domain